MGGRNFGREKLYESVKQTNQRHEMAYAFYINGLVLELGLGGQPRWYTERCLLSSLFLSFISLFEQRYIVLYI